MDRVRPEIVVVTDHEDAKALNTYLCQQPIVSVDSEWIDFDPDRHPYNNGRSLCWTFCFRRADGELKLFFLYNYEEGEGNVHLLDRFWRDPNIIKTAHNTPSDWHILANQGIVGEGFVFDTMVMDHLLDENRENRHGLKECAWDFLHVDRKDFAHTFGTPRLREDGQPYASGQMIVPSLKEVVKNPEQWQILLDYACDDALDGWLLYELYREKLEAIPWVNGKTMWDYYVEVDSPITKVICKMERRGMPVDLPFMLEMAEICKGDLDEMEAKALEWAGCPMNIGSGKQLGMLLYGHGNQEVKKNKNAKRVEFYIPGKGWPVFHRTPSGEPSTTAEHLKELRRNLEKGYQDPRTGRTVKVEKEDLRGFDHILNHKKLEKQKNTYLVNLPEKTVGGRFRERINQIGTTSGRFSMSSLMLIPTGDKDLYHIRDGFHASPGKCLIVCDWANLEYRLLAHFSQDPTLIKLFSEGLDMHSMTTYNIYENIKLEVNERFGEFTKEAGKWIAETYPDQRKACKTLNFEIIYGVGYKKLAEQLRLSDDEAKRMINGWFQGYPYVKYWMNHLLDELRKTGQTQLLDGRWRHANMSRLMNEEYWIRGEEERTLINSKIQGSAAAMAKRAMIRIDADEAIAALGYELLLQVHDELIGECPIETAKEAAELIRPIMEQPFSRPLRLKMPVSIGIGPSWESAKS